MSAQHIIVNPAAAGGRAMRALPAVQSRLHELGLNHRITFTRDLTHACQAAREAAAAGEVAVAFGGDGLIGAVAGALAGGDGVLGVLPGGRGNDFARTLGLPLKAVAACDVLATGTPRPLDLGRVGSKTFIGIASCGFDSEANRIANAARIVRGNLVYAYGALRALASWAPATFEVEVDGGEPQSIHGYTVAAANARAYGGGMLMAPQASLHDGLLDIVTISHMPKPRLLRLLPTVFFGAHVRQPEVEIRRGRRVRISASRPFTVYADGDPIAELPVEIEVVPAAVRVLVPSGT